MRVGGQRWATKLVSAQNRLPDDSGEGRQVDGAELLGGQAARMDV